jgi:hypothetical protein
VYTQLFRHSTREQHLSACPRQPSVDDVRAPTLSILVPSPHHAAPRQGASPRGAPPRGIQAQAHEGVYSQLFRHSPREQHLSACPRQPSVDDVRAPTPPSWSPHLTTQHHDKEHHHEESIRIKVCNPCPDNLQDLSLKVRIPCASQSSDDLCIHMSSLRLPIWRRKRPLKV